MKTSLRTIPEITKGLIGELSWGVKWERQLNLTMSFGNPKLKIRESHVSNSKSLRVRENSSRRKVAVKGKWWLWIFCAYWKIVIPELVTAAYSSPLRMKRKAMIHLDGQRLEAIHINPNHGGTEFIFDLGAVLKVRRMEKASDADVWILYKPDGHVLGVRGGGATFFL